jgi:hypothetical protein
MITYCIGAVPESPASAGAWASLDRCSGKKSLGKEPEAPPCPVWRLKIRFLAHRLGGPFLRSSGVINHNVQSGAL